VLAVLLAFGIQAALPRERVEYLRQLPFPRREVARSMHAAALAVLLSACVLDALNWEHGFVPDFLAWLGWPTWRQEELHAETPHLEWVTWFDLLGLPLLGYWATVTVLLRRRRQSKEMLPRVSWLVLLGTVLLWPGLFLAALYEREQFGAWGQVASGLSAVLLAWLLARRALARAERMGIDAYPEEDRAWES